MVSDVLQWKNSSHTSSSIGLGFKLENVTHDVNRDVHHTHDYIRKLLEDDMRNMLRDTVTMYHDHFATKISIRHREEIRNTADDLWDRAKNKIKSEANATVQGKIDLERMLLEQQLCSLRVELNGIGGSTRSCFAQSVIAKTIAEGNIKFGAIKSEAALKALELETQAMNDAAQFKYAAYITADQIDFSKYENMFNILKGAWDKINFADDTNDKIHETTVDFTLTGQWNRTAGSISDADGSYAGDQSAINGAWAVP